MSFSVLDQIESSLAVKRVGIQEFAESAEYCDKPLYPRQLVLLKLIFLEEMEGWEEDVLTYWLNGARGGNEIEISPDVRERRAWLRENGYKHFREPVLVGGRRSSKGFVTGIAMGKVMFDTLQLQDPGRYYGIDPTKNIMFSCIAGSEEQAKEYQFADFSGTIDSCKSFDRHVVKSLETEIRVATETDLRLAMQAKARGNKTQKDIARIRGKALASNAGTLRGSATIAACIDEMAHMLEGISKASASTVYEALEPSLDQFRQDGILFCNPPEAPIWMADLSFTPIGKVQVGDKIIGWDAIEGKKHKELVQTVVTGIQRRKAPIVKVTMESGRTFRCTADHRWLTLSTGGKKGYYKQGGEWFVAPQVGKKLVRVIDPTRPLHKDQMLDASWLGGIWDGEGYAARGKAVTICQSHEHNPLICDRIENVLTDLGVEWVYHRITNKLGTAGAYHILGGKQGATDFANWTRPTQIHKLQGKVLTGRWRIEDRIVSVEEDGYGEVVALTTATGNYIVNGYASKNCNSSPYTEVGKFHEKYREGLVPMAEEGNPRVLTFRFPSWALYEGFQGYRTKWAGRGFDSMPTASADWNIDDKAEDGTDLWPEKVKQSILLAKASEAAKPDVYKVERRSQFAVVTDAFLNPAMVERMYAGVPVGYDEEQRPIYEPINTNWGEGVRNIYRYKGHLDPSSTTAGFGFAIGHLENFVSPNGEEEPHVVFDIIKRWKPQDFKGGAIHWDTVMSEVMTYIELFRPYELTLDQYNSAEPIQKLNKELRERNLEGIRIYEKTATPEVNWKRADVYKTALYQGFVHAPNDTVDTAYSALELKFLQEHRMNSKWSRIDHPSVGEVKTKDMADCYDDQTEVLTENGWKLFSDVEENERVATRSPEGELEYQLPTERVERRASELLYYEETRLNFAVTPRHRVLIGDNEFILAENLVNNFYKVPKTATLHSYIASPTLDDEAQEDFARFVGFWLADGRKCKSYDGHHGVRLSQTKPEGIAWVDALLNRMGWRFKRWVQGKDEVVWHITSNPLRGYLTALQERDELRLPSDAYTWNAGSREGLLEGLLVGDGVWCNQQKRHIGFWNTSEQLIDDVQRLLIHHGLCGRKQMKRPAGTVVNVYKGKAIASTRDLFYLHIDMKSDAKLFSNRVEKRSYSGMVYCLTVPNGTLMVRRSGVPMWCGNCIMEVTNALIGNLIASRIQQGITSHMLVPGAQGGYRIGGDTLSDRGRATPDAMRASLGQRKGEQSMKGQRDGRRPGISVGRRRSRGW